MKKAFVLGGTVPHIELIKKLKAMGYYVYLIDYTENPPAKKMADEHLLVSTLDSDMVLRLAKQYGVDLVISTCIDQANSTACYVGEKLGLGIPYSFSTSLDVTKKDLMKSKFVENGIRTSDFYLISKDDERVIKKNFPFVIKPTDSNSSKGVFKIFSKDDFYDKIEASINISKEGKVIVEDFIEGTEIQVDCVSIDGKAYVVMTKDKIRLTQDGKELQSAGYMIPGKNCDKYREEIILIAQKIVDAFNLNNTPFFFQAICNESGVYVIEFAPRVAGGTTFAVSKKYFGYDLVDSAIASFMNRPISNIIKTPEEKIVTKFLYMKPGIFDHIEGLDFVMSDELVDDFIQFAFSGKVINNSMNSGNRIAAIMCRGMSYDLCEKKLFKALEQIKLIDNNGVDRSFWK